MSDLSDFRLYHFTCSHAVAGIEANHRLIPHPQPLLGDVPLVWLTDDPTCTADELGLTSTIITCDRTEHVYAVDGRYAAPWLTFRQRLLPAFSSGVSMLELGRSPARWWIATQPVPVLAHRTLPPS